MKHHPFFRPATVLAILLLAFGLVTRGQAQHNTNTTGTVHADAGVTTLNDAYATMDQIKHPYLGHRALAMKHIAAAIKELGGTVNPHHANRLEPQGTADAQLKAAEGLLQKVVTGLSGNALADVNAAITEINDALTGK
jgi:hypothetical protein